ncbi:MAG: PAS domain-containing protein [Calditrichaeota bacterium]|nr:PAS domain-containing protein [Calditrichota bacterium]MCB9367871.1 PAS domain-containing protein [Calditrichota bacterium]
MRPFVKIIGIAVGLTGLLGGALLSMGHLRTAEGDFQELEMARLKNLASSWETQILSVRSAFRDQLLRHGVTVVVEHPSDWAAWRVENKIEQMTDDWPAGLAKPRGWALLRANGDTHALTGDSTGLGEALDDFAQQDAPDIILTEKSNGAKRCLVLQYAPPADDKNTSPGRLVAFIDAQDLFKVPTDPPAEWVLMNGPKDTYLASARRSEPPIGVGTWGILLSQASGLITMDDGLPLAFCRIHVPGMQPLLVVSEISSPTNAGTAAGALLLLAAGTAMLVFVLRPRKKSEPEDAAPQGETEDGKPTRDPVTFRQIFQAVRTPMCVADESGRLLRVNSAARELLYLPKGGQPDESITVIGKDFSGTLREFFIKAAGSDYAGGSWLLSRNNKHYFDGKIVATKLSGSIEQSGPVALEFVENAQASASTQPTTLANTATVDSLNPQPIMLINEEGRVFECNRAALDVNTKLADSPLLHEVLPGLELSNLAALTDPDRAQKFESLFGSRLYEFHPVHTASGMLLYGQKKSDSQSLQIALHQAQENFNTLCGLCDEAILLVDPRTHMIQEANLSASDLFGAIHPGLVGKSMDEYADWPWLEDTLRASVQLQRGDGQIVPCSFEHELVKIEGEPTLLVVVSRVVEEERRNIHELADYAQSVAERLSETMNTEPEPQTEAFVPLGPGMLVVTNPTVRDVARRMLEHLGHPCEVFTNLDDATLYLVRSDVRPEFVMIDLGDFDQPGDWVEMVRARCGSVPCVGLTDTHSEDLPDGPNAVLPKPFELEDVSQSFQTLELDTTVETG